MSLLEGRTKDLQTPRGGGGLRKEAGGLYESQTCHRTVAAQQQNKAATFGDVTSKTETKHFWKATSIGSRYGALTDCSY